MSDAFPPPGDEQPPPPGYGQQPPPYGSQEPYGYQQQGYGYTYGPTYSYAGFWRRLVGAILDGLILTVPTSLIDLAIGGGDFNAGAGYGFTPGQAAAARILGTVIGILYYGYFEGTRGQTIGKMAVGIKVIDQDSGAYIGIGRAIGRYLMSILSGLALGLGYLWMLWDPRKQTWHDKVARSVVVR